MTALAVQRLRRWANALAVPLLLTLGGLGRYVHHLLSVARAALRFKLCGAN